MCERLGTYEPPRARNSPRLVSVSLDSIFEAQGFPIGSGLHLLDLRDPYLEALLRAEHSDHVSVHLFRLELI